MTKFLLIIIAILAVVAGAFFFLWRISQEKQKKTQAELEQKKKELESALEQITKLKGTIEIMNKNRREADEKIDALNSGDPTGNALDELSKH